MKIDYVYSKGIFFDNGNSIIAKHEAECSEKNYADLSVLTEDNVNWNFDFSPDLEFKFEDGMGFKFGSKDKNGLMHWIFIPCYSEQNGYYSSDIDILYVRAVLNGLCKRKY